MCMHLVGQSHISDWCRCVGFGQATDEHIAKYNQYGFAVKNVQTEWMLHGEAATVKHITIATLSSHNLIILTVSLKSFE